MFTLWKLGKLQVWCCLTTTNLTPHICRVFFVVKPNFFELWSVNASRLHALLPQMTLPWGSLSSLKLDCRSQSDDGPIMWVRPGEQMVPTADMPKSPFKRRRYHCSAAAKSCRLKCFFRFILKSQSSPPRHILLAAGRWTRSKTSTTSRGPASPGRFCLRTGLRPTPTTWARALTGRAPLLWACWRQCTLENGEFVSAWWEQHRPLQCICV